MFCALVASFLLFVPANADPFQGGNRLVHLNGQALDVTWDSATSVPHTITAVGSDLLEVKNIGALTKKEINDIGALLIFKYGSLLKVRPEHLVLRKAEKSDGIWHVSYQQVVHGVAVYDSSLWFSIDPEGRIKSLEAILYPDARVPGSLKVQPGQALRTAHKSLPEAGKKEYLLRDEAMAIYPERKAEAVDYRQVYIFRFLPRKAGRSGIPAGGRVILVDAQTGRVLRTHELNALPGNGRPKETVPEETYQ